MLRQHNDGLNNVLVDFKPFFLGQNTPSNEKIVEFSGIVGQVRNLKIEFQDIFLLARKFSGKAENIKSAGHLVSFVRPKYDCPSATDLKPLFFRIESGSPDLLFINAMELTA